MPRRDPWFHRTLIEKHLIEASWFWLPCGLCLFVFTWMFVFVQSQIDMSFFQAIIAKVPDFAKRLTPIPIDQLVSYPARIALAFEDPTAYLLMALWCIARSSDVVSGELGRGTLELVLAQPVRRVQVLVASTTVTLVGVFLLAAAAWFGLAAGIATVQVKTTRVTWARAGTEGSVSPIPFERKETVVYTPMSQYARSRDYLPAVANYACFGIFLCGVGTLLSAIDSYRWRTIGLMAGFYVVQVIMELLGQSVASMRWMRGLTFLRAYEPVAFVTSTLKDPDLAWAWVQPSLQGPGLELGSLTGCAILAVLGGLGLFLAARIFQARDLPAPL